MALPELGVPPPTWTTWTPAPLVLVGAAASAMLFALGFRRLRDRGRTDHACWWRATLFAGAVLLGVLALVSPLDSAADSLLYAHMLQHVLLGDVAPALLLLSLRGPLFLFVLPAPLLHVLFRRRQVRRTAALLLRPRVSLTLWAAAVAAWHVPAAYDYALAHPFVHELEHASFAVGGLLAWSQVIDPARRRMLTIPQRVCCAGAMLAVSSILGAVLLFSGPLYPAYADQPVRLLALSPLLDQRLAAWMMMAEQLAAFAVCAAILLSRATPVTRPARGYASPSRSAGTERQMVT